MEFRLAKINDLPAVQAMYRALISDLRARGLDLWSDYYPCEFFIRDIEMNRLYLLSEGETPAAAFALDDSTLGSESGSVMVTSLCFFSLPSFFSTVTPGQLPTYWLAPVRALNNVVLPQLGLPARAILISMKYPSFR